MKTAIYIIFIIFSSLNIISQEIVISEYYNDQDVENEWTELIVTEDFLNLEGYLLRDNNDNFRRGGFWQGGVTFNQNSLWKNLRIGTIIVINHRDVGSTDSDASDGYIEVNALDSKYFNKSNWRNSSSLSIDDQADILQILDTSDNNVHSLGHVQYASEGDFHDIIGAKIAYVGNCPKGYSISVGNASTLQNYSVNSGYDTGKSITLRQLGGTKGLANLNPVGAAINYQFWQKIREPEFLKPNLKATIDDSTVVLDWDPIEIDSDKNDYSGYIILRTTDVVNNICKPKDGTMYSVGDKICSTSDVVAVLEGKDWNQYIDINPICGEYVRYTVFAYNFINSEGNLWDIKDGRGIAYSRRLDYYNSTQLKLDKPDSVFIKSRLGDVFCSMDTTVLYNNYKNHQKGKYKYAWLYKNDRNGSEVVVVDFSANGISDSIKVYRTGYYTLVVKSDDGCEIESNTLELKVLDTPEAFISDKNNKIIESDSTIYLCDGEDLYFQGSRDLSIFIKLYNGKVWVNNSGNLFKISQPGSYYYVYSNGNCRDTSNIITVKESDYAISADKEKLKYQLITNQTEETKIVQLTNNSNTTQSFSEEEFEIKPPFSILNSFPIIINGEDSVDLEIEFKPIITGLFIDTMSIIGECNDELRIALTGVKTNTSAALVSSHDSIDYKEHVVCTYGGVDSTVTLTNIGTEKIVVKEMYGGADFFANPKIENDTLLPGETLPFKLGTSTKNSDVETTNILNIPWESEFGVKDTLHISARIHVGRPRFEVLEDILDFGTVYGCENFKIDTIHIENTGLFDVTINGEDLIDGLELIDAPIVIKPGEIKEVQIKYSSDSPISINNSNRFKVVPGCILEDSFFVKAERASSGYQYDIAEENLEFNGLYSCDNLNVTKNVIVTLLENPDNSDIEIQAKINNASFEIGEFDNALSDKLEIPITLKETEPGTYTSVIELTINPCDRVEIIRVIAEIKEQDVDVTDFNIGSYEVGFNSNGEFDIKNNSQEDVNITDIILPNSLSFVNNIIYPIILTPNEVEQIEVKHESMLTGFYADSIEIITDSPCIKSYYSKFNGDVTPSAIPPGKIIAEFGVDRQAFPPKNKINVPIKVSSFIHEFDSVEIKSMTLNVMYPFNAFEIIDITTNQNDLDIEYDDSFGNLTLNIQSINTDKFKVTESNLIEIEFFILDATPGDYQVDLISGIMESFPLMSVETDDNTTVEILENCINDDSFVFLQPVKLNADYIDNNLVINYYQPSNDKYTLSLYNSNGNMLLPLLDMNTNSGDYKFEINSSNLSSGQYFILLEYSDKVISKGVNIVK